MANREELGIIRGARAGRASAQLELGKRYLFGSAGLPRSLPSALHWLDRAAKQDCAEAWELIGTHLRPAHLAAPAPPAAGIAARPAPAARPGPAAGGEPHPLEPLWRAGQVEAWLEAALPTARALLQAAPAWLAPAEARLVSRCASLLAQGLGGPASGVSAAGVLRMWELAAAGNDAQAQLAMGLHCARMQADGSRAPGAGSANFKRATRWLALAAGHGLPQACYALASIYAKPEFSQRNIETARGWLERAAGMGLRQAQLECGLQDWRERREHGKKDVRALYWLQLAARQGCDEAEQALRRAAPRLQGSLYSWNKALVLPDGLAASVPLLAARLELASLFGLSRAETLLLDVAAADHGHCLVVDIRASYGRSKRRLVLVENAQQRQALDRIAPMFVQAGQEGNYRQRLYRLKTLVPMAGQD